VDLSRHTLLKSDSAGNATHTLPSPGFAFFFSSCSRHYCNATYYGTVTSTIHDAQRFRLDLIKEHQRLQSPQYPQRAFWRALEVADHADVVRAVTAVNASEDAYYFDRQQSRQFTDLDDADPRYLMAGYSIERTAKRAVGMAYARQFRKGARAAVPQPEVVCS
jgi:hypothetical protein